MISYLQVSEDEGEEPIELPSEDDGTLLLSTLSAQFPGACGLKYRSTESKAFRGIRLLDGRLHPPDEGWSDIVFYCVYPKENKRKSDDVLENVTAKTKRIETKIKCTDLIVLGLPWTLTESQLKEYFETYGEVLMALIKKDIKTGRSKGYGFIRFANYESQARVVSKRHLIDGRWCAVKVPNSKEGQYQELPSKVFVGRITDDISAEDMKEYFSKFGEVLDVFLPKPCRGFAFVTFLDPNVAQALCGEDHIIKQTSVHVSPASARHNDGNRGSRFKSNGNYSGGEESRASPRGYGGPGPLQSWETQQPVQQQARPPTDMPNLQSLGITNQAPAQLANPLNNLGLANLSALAMTPALLAAALNQAGLGSLLNLQGTGGQGQQGPPPPQYGPPAHGPPSQQPPQAQRNWAPVPPSM